MNKMTIEDLRKIFSSPRTDHPGRKANINFTRGNGALSKDGKKKKNKLT